MSNFRSRRQGQALLMIMGLLLTGILLIEGITKLSQPVTTQLMNQEDRVRYEALLSSTLEYVKYAIQSRWCVDGVFAKDINNPCNWVTQGANQAHPHDLGKLLLDQRSWVALNSSLGLANYDLNVRNLTPITTINVSDPNCNLASETPNPPANPTMTTAGISGTLSFDMYICPLTPSGAANPALGASHPLYTVLHSVLQPSQFPRWIRIQIDPINNINYPTTGREIYLNIKVTLGIQVMGLARWLTRNNLWMQETVAYYPRELGRFALIAPNNLYLADSTMASDGPSFKLIGDMAFPPPAGGGSFIFQSPVFVNNSLILPPDGTTSAVTFSQGVVLGSGTVMQSSGKPGVNVPYVQLQPGSILNRYYNQDPNFSGFAKGVSIDGVSDNGLYALFGYPYAGSTASPASSALYAQCVERAEVLSNITKTAGAALVAKMMQAPISYDGTSVIPKNVNSIENYAWPQSPTTTPYPQGTEWDYRLALTDNDRFQSQDSTTPIAGNIDSLFKSANYNTTDVLFKAHASVDNSLSGEPFIPYAGYNSTSPVGPTSLPTGPVVNTVSKGAVLFVSMNMNLPGWYRQYPCQGANYASNAKNTPCSSKNSSQYNPLSATFPNYNSFLPATPRTSAPYTDWPKRSDGSSAGTDSPTLVATTNMPSTLNYSPPANTTNLVPVSAEYDMTYDSHLVISINVDTQYYRDLQSAFTQELTLSNYQSYLTGTGLCSGVTQTSQPSGWSNSTMMPPKIIPAPTATNKGTVCPQVAYASYLINNALTKVAAFLTGYNATPTPQPQIVIESQSFTPNYTGAATYTKCLDPTNCPTPTTDSNFGYYRQPNQELFSIRTVNEAYFPWGYEMDASTGLPKPTLMGSVGAPRIEVAAYDLGFDLGAQAYSQADNLRSPAINIFGAFQFERAFTPSQLSTATDLSDLVFATGSPQFPQYFTAPTVTITPPYFTNPVTTASPYNLSSSSSSNYPFSIVYPTVGEWAWFAPWFAPSSSPMVNSDLNATFLLQAGGCTLATGCAPVEWGTPSGSAYPSSYGPPLSSGPVPDDNDDIVDEIDVPCDAAGLQNSPAAGSWDTPFTNSAPIVWNSAGDMFTNNNTTRYNTVTKQYDATIPISPDNTISATYAANWGVTNSEFWDNPSSGTDAESLVFDKYNAGGFGIITGATAAEPTRFVVRSVVNRCVISSTAQIVAGFLVCKELTIMPRTQPLIIIGTIITDGINTTCVDALNTTTPLSSTICSSPLTATPTSALQTAIQYGTTWMSVYNPVAIRDLQLLGILKPSSSSAYSSCITAQAGGDPVPLWTPTNDPSLLEDSYYCSPASLRSMFEPIAWSSVDPDCGIVGAGTQCHDEVTNYLSKDLMREDNL